MAPVNAVAALVGRSERTVRRWAQLGLVESCRGSDGHMLVWAQQALQVERDFRMGNKPERPGLGETGNSEGMPV